MSKIKVSIIGASGYVGGEALRILLGHPKVEVVQVSSESNVGKFVHFSHPNLRKRTMLKFSSIKNLKKVDVLFLALPHGISSQEIDYLMSKSDKIIDKGADFRLNNKEDYLKWYNYEHPRADLLKKFVYGIPELHRDEIKKTKFVAAAGCNATNRGEDLLVSRQSVSPRPPGQSLASAWCSSPLSRRHPSGPSHYPASRCRLGYRGARPASKRS